MRSNELFFVIVQSFSRAKVEKLQPLKNGRLYAVGDPEGSCGVGFLGLEGD